jgi:hypothetical protein
MQYQSLLKFISIIFMFLDHFSMIKLYDNYFIDFFRMPARIVMPTLAIAFGFNFVNNERIRYKLLPYAFILQIYYYLIGLNVVNVLFSFFLSSVIIFICKNNCRNLIILFGVFVVMSYTQYAIKYFEYSACVFSYTIISYVYYKYLPSKELILYYIFFMNASLNNIFFLYNGPMALLNYIYEVGFCHYFVNKKLNDKIAKNTIIDFASKHIIYFYLLSYYWLLLVR